MLFPLSLFFQQPVLPPGYSPQASRSPSPSRVPKGGGAGVAGRGARHPLAAAPHLCAALRGRPARQQRRGRERSAVPGLTSRGLPAPEAARRYPHPPPHPSLPPPPPSLPPGALCTFFSNHSRRQTLMGDLAPLWKNAGYEGITGTPEHLPRHHRHPVRRHT